MVLQLLPKGSLIGVPLALRVGIPPTPDRAPNPHLLEKRASGCKKHPLPLGLEKKREFSVQKSPFFYKGTQGKWGIF